MLLRPFADHGFYTSYYLPSFNPYDISSNELKNYATEIAHNLSSSNVNAISGYYYQYPFMQKYFPDTDLLVWHIDTQEKDNPFDIFAYIIRRQLLNNSQIKVILIPEMSDGFYNRLFYPSKFNHFPALIFDLTCGYDIEPSWQF